MTDEELNSKGKAFVYRWASLDLAEIDDFDELMKYKKELIVGHIYYLRGLIFKLHKSYKERSRNQRKKIIQYKDDIKKLIETIEGLEFLENLRGIK